MAKDVRIAIVGDASGLKRSTDEAEGILGSFGTKVAGFASGLVAGFGVERIGSALNGMIQGAADVGESLSKNAVVFGEGADQITAAAKDAATKLGLSEKDYLALSGTVGVLGKAAGKTGDELGDFANTLLARAGDVASFNNATTPEVVEAFGAALRGEAEPARRFGILLDDAALRAKALELGLIKTTKDALTPQQKALAANALIMEQTSDAAGDFARTSDGLANKQRILKAQLANVSTEVGAKLLPAFSSVVSWISSNGIPALAKFGEWIGPKLAAVVEVAKAAWPAFRDAIKAAFDWLTTNVPPIVQAVVAAVMAAFQWIKDNVVPIVVDVVGYVVEQFGNLVEWVEENWPAISEAIGHVMVAIQAVIEAVIEVVQKAWELWGDNLLKILKAGWELIKTAVETAINIVAGIIKLVVDTINGDWKKAWEDLKKILSDTWDLIYTVLRTAVTTVAEILKAIWAPIELGFSAAWTFISATWNTIETWVKGLPAAIATAASGMWDGFKSAFKSAINWIIEKWNGLEFTIPGFEFMGVKVGGITIGVPDIPKLASGGIVNRPTLALIGEAGPEAVVPLNRAGGGGMGSTYNVTINAAPGTNGAELGRQFVDYITAYERVNGKGWRAAA